MTEDDQQYPFPKPSVSELRRGPSETNLGDQMCKILNEHHKTSTVSMARLKSKPSNCRQPSSSTTTVSIPSIVLTSPDQEQESAEVFVSPTKFVKFMVGGSPTMQKKSFISQNDDETSAVENRVRYANGTASTSLHVDHSLLSPPTMNNNHLDTKLSNTLEISQLQERRPSGWRKTGRNEANMDSSKRKSLCPPLDFKARQLFIQLNELYLPTTVDGQMQWWQAARWLKYEEDVEAGAERWGRPHVASLSFHSLLELRKCIEGGSVLLDIDGHDMYSIATSIVDDMVDHEYLHADDAQFVIRALLLPHKRVQDRQKEIYDLRRQTTYNSLEDYFYRQQSLLSPMPGRRGGGTAFSLGDVLVRRKRTASCASSSRQQSSAKFRNCVTRVMTLNETVHNFDRKQSVAWRKLSSVRLPKEGSSEAAMFLPKRRVMETIVDKGDSDNDTEDGLAEDKAKTYDPQTLLTTAYDRLCCCPYYRCMCKLFGRRPNKWRDRKTGQATVLRPGTDMELLKRIPTGTEAGVVLVGAVDFLEKPIVSFVRLDSAVTLPHITEIPIPIRFIFVLLGPLTAGIDYHEIGRSISTLLSTKSFCEAAYAASMRDDLLLAIHDFLDDSIVLPPGDWDQKNLLPYEQIKNKNMYLSHRRKQIGESQEDILALFKHDPLSRTGSMFGGLLHEARDRFPKYLSDFKDACHVKCLACIVFIFFACFFPALTFGNILEVGTSGTIGVKETLVSTSLGGVVFALFSTQPMLLLGVCGPMLIYEQALYKFCKTYVGKMLYKYAFLQVRVWTAGWALIFCILCTAFEGSFLIRYLTRFSDDILAALVALIFISECFIFLIETYNHHPLSELRDYCTIDDALFINNTSYDYNMTDCPSTACLQHRKPNVAVLSIVLVFATFFLAVIFKSIRTSKFFGRQIRKAIGDFGLSLSIIIVVLFDLFLADNVTSKVDVGQGLFNYTVKVVQPWPVANWPLFAGSAVAGLFLFVVLFTENQVTEMMMSKKECGLKKGTGYHWDLLLSGILLFVCAVLKLPWLCAAPVRSHAHVNSLTKYKLRAPGQAPEVHYVLEQRVTGLILHLLIGLSLAAPGVLNIIPKAVLFGVFLYLGVMSLQGLQMLSRTILFFVPTKYHPCSVYCLRVQTRRMHAFTCLQLFLLTVVCSVKMVKPISFAFPIAIIGTILIRHLLLHKFFNNVELAALDSEDEHVDEDADFYSFSRIPL